MGAAGQDRDGWDERLPADSGARGHLVARALTNEPDSLRQHRRGPTARGLRPRRSETIPVGDLVTSFGAAHQLCNDRRTGLADSARKPSRTDKRSSSDRWDGVDTSQRVPAFHPILPANAIRLVAGAIAQSRRVEAQRQRARHHCRRRANRRRRMVYDDRDERTGAALPGDHDGRPFISRRGTARVRRFRRVGTASSRF